MTLEPHNHIENQTLSDLKHNGLIPEKKYFKIGEVCDIAGLKQHVLRYWESEFKQFIRPQRASSKQRLYRRVDVENLLRLQKLLKEDGLTISGARKFLASNRNSIEVQSEPKQEAASPSSAASQEQTPLLPNDNLRHFYDGSL